MADVAAEGPAFDPAMFPQGRRTLRQLILDHNPCFLFSTLLMLLGCYLLNSALDVRAGDGGKLLGLLGVTAAELLTAYGETVVAAQF